MGMEKDYEKAKIMRQDKQKSSGMKRVRKGKNKVPEHKPLLSLLSLQAVRTEFRSQDPLRPP